MKVAFVTNYYNHHQKPFADAMYLLLGEDYCLIETSRISQERLKLGWGGDERPSYVLQNFGSSEAFEKCQQLINEADVVIMGSAPRSLLSTRLKAGKFTFFYSERIYKNKPPFYKYPVHFLKNLKNIIRHKNLYLLCASAYTSGDYAKVCTFINKCYKWGYFTELKKYDDIDVLIQDKTPASILWVSRFISWKHPEHALEVAERLKGDGYKFKLGMIGNGPLEGKIVEAVEKKDLWDSVEILGSMKPDQVRENMEKSAIFLFTSDRNEGWGAVLNESMNSACAVVANSAIGSVPFLMEDGENGYMYKDGDVDDLYAKVKRLLDNAEERKRISKNAYKTMVDEWNAENAAKKFVELCKTMLNGEYKPFPFEKGVCSKAEVLKDGWY
ncbi:MAG: glycosyltransferase [Clostridia bacterium]|nr:glycosyltransferase [Clostridia bacterium]